MRDARGLSQADLAVRVGVRQQTIGAIEAGKTTRSKFLPRIARVLGVPLDRIDEEASQPEPNETATQAAATLPIYGTAEAGDGALVIAQDVIDTMPRPAGLMAVPDAYGLYVVGDSMSPVIRPGTLLAIHPHMPAQRDDPVVLYSADRSRAQLKEYVGATAAEWRLRRYQPKEAEFTLSRKEWPRCHLVYARFSRR